MLDELDQLFWILSQARLFLVNYVVEKRQCHRHHHVDHHVQGGR